MIAAALIVVLFAFSPAASGSVSHCRRRLRRHARFTPRSPGDAMAVTIWGWLRLDADRPAAIPVDGRDPVPHTPLGRHVQRAWPLAGSPARPPAAHQHHRLHDLRRRLGIFGGDLRHHRQDHLPELKKRGYPDHMALGTIAGAGTLGLLIPPSIIMIVYGVTAEVSIAKLFIGGVLPGLLLAGLFMGW